MTRAAEENNALVEAYLQYLEHSRAYLEGLLAESPQRQAADDEAWETFHELSRRDAATAWTLILEVLRRCADEDLSLIGAGLLEEFVVLHPEMVADFDAMIRSNDRFLRAFQYVAMTGVPLPVQQRLNAALRARGVDPKWLVEYDETLEDDE